MLKLLRQENYQSMPWKNGGGTTSQICILPAESDPAANSFHWRLSSATVSQSGPFSLFPGYDRWLVVIEGKGLVINGTDRALLKPFKFSGDIPIHCQLQGDRVVDIGLIFRRDKFAQTKMEVLELAKAETKYFEPGTHLFYNLDNGFKVNGINAAAGDTVLIEGPFEASVGPMSEPARVVYVKLLP